MLEDKKNSEGQHTVRGRIVKIVAFGLKTLFFIFIFSCLYILIGFPVTKAEFYDLLPSFITITSVLLVFYNVNRTQLKNFENENKKFRRDARVKVADELVDCFAGLDDVVKEIDEYMHFDQYSAENINKLREMFGEYSKKIKTIFYKRKEVIEFSEDPDDRYAAKNLIYSIKETIYQIEKRLIILNEENCRETFKELRVILKEDILIHREEVVKTLYGNIFKQRTYSDFNSIEKLKYDAKQMGILAYGLPLVLIIYTLLYFKTFLLDLFIK